MRTRTVHKELGHRNESEDIDLEHRLVVGVRDVSNLLNTKHEARIVDCENYALSAKKKFGSTMPSIRHTKDVDVTEVLWDLVVERRDLLPVADIELNSRKFSALLET